MTMRSAIAAILSLFLTSPALAQQVGPDAGPLGKPGLYRPAAGTTPTRAIILFSGPSGWGKAADMQARELASQTGALVMGVDTPATLARIEAAPWPCVNLLGDIEGLSHTVQRMAGGGAYSFPVLMGEDVGGTLAMAVASQASITTLGGVVVANPQTALPLKKPLCTKAPIHTTNDGTQYGLPAEAADFTLHITLSPQLPPSRRAAMETLKGLHPRMVTLTTGTDTISPALLNAAYPPPPPAVDNAGNGASLDDLPLVELPTDGQAGSGGGTMAILYSGDGGWRDLDKSLATILQQKGIPVVGVDALRYFWSKRTMDQTAHDLGRIIDTYTARWKAPQVILIGFSFGADIMPPAFNRLSPAQQGKVRQISLLALSFTTDLEVTVNGWIGTKKDKDSQPTLPELAKIPGTLVQCFYGADDDDAACAQAPKDVQVIRTRGGHHFDGNYPKLADQIIAGTGQRGRAAP